MGNSARLRQYSRFPKSTVETCSGSANHRPVSYQVFARKYRPRTFADVLGQEHVVRTLRNAIAQNRLAHAYLFVGPRGTGKTSTARIFAKALNCSNGPRVEFDPDEVICQEIEKGICLDVREIDGASNNGVEQVRELREEVKFAPSRCRFKIYYIDEVPMLSTAAFNALLKTLEEPPAHVKFIFATTEANKVLPTIISRCQRFDLRRIPAALIAKHLLHIATLENVNLEEKAAYAIAKGAEGGMRDAQSMLDQLVAFCGGQITEQDTLDIFGFTRGETVANLAQRVMDQDTVGALRELHSQADAGKDLGRLLADLIQHFRAILVHQVDAAAAEEDASPEVVALMRSQAQMWPAQPLLAVMDGLAEVDARMRWAANKLLHFEIGLIQAVQTLGEVTLSDVIEALGQSGGGSGSPPVSRRPAPVSSPAPAPRPAPRPVQEVAPPVAAAPAATPVAPPPVSPTPAAPGPISEVREERPMAVFQHAAPASPPVVVPVAPTPPPAPVPPAEIMLSLSMEEPVAPPKSSLDGEELWGKALERIHTERPLIFPWMEMGALQSMEGGKLTFGLPTTESMGRENLLRPLTKKFLEGVFSDLSGQPLQITIVLDPSLKPPPATEMELSLDVPAPKPPAASAAAVKEPAKVATQAAPAPPAAMETFYDDPLIKKALEQFKATLVN